MKPIDEMIKYIHSICECGTMGQCCPRPTVRAKSYAIQIDCIQKKTIDNNENNFKNFGWTITQRTKHDNFIFYNTIVLEPDFEDYIPIVDIPNGQLFHSTPISNCESIIESGIKPFKGGNTFFNRTYSLRVHLATSIDGAVKFALSCYEYDNRKSK